MKTIWKHALRMGSNVLEAKGYLDIISLHTQRGGPCVWFICDPSSEMIVRKRITIYCTGDNLPENPGRFIGTFLVNSDTLVFHVFEEDEL